MARPRKKAKKHTGRAQRLGEPTYPDALKDLSFVSGKFDRAAFRSFVRAFQTYEDWVTHGKREGKPPTVDTLDLPGYAEESVISIDGAFDYLRHAYRRYMGAVPHEPGYAAGLASLVRRAEVLDPRGFETFSAALAQAHTRFLRQWRNSQTEHHRTLNSADVDRLDALVRWFTNFYETDGYLWFVGVVARAARTGKVDANFLGGPSTRTAQASLVKQVLNELDSHPLAAPLGRVYNSSLRNALSHNDYEWVRFTDGAWTFIDHSSGNELSETELYAFLAEAQVFEQAMLSAILSQAAEPRAAERDDLRAAGIIDFVSIESEGGVALIVFQLWCFWNLDPEGTWLDGGQVSIRDEPCDECLSHSYLRLGSVGRVNIPSDHAANLVEAMKQVRWVHVWRVPVAPYIGAKGLRLALPSGPYVVTGIPDRHLVPFDGTS